jgi:hypothetical protein
VEIMMVILKVILLTVLRGIELDDLDNWCLRNTARYARLGAAGLVNEQINASNLYWGKLAI